MGTNVLIANLTESLKILIVSEISVHIFDQSKLAIRVEKGSNSALQVDSYI